MRFICIIALFITLAHNLTGQSNYRLIKDTTDSNSIANKVQKIREIEILSNAKSTNLSGGGNGQSIKVDELKKIPNILGDADPFKSLQLMGGISQAGDASANMIVRGGNNDQNLVLFNGASIQNPTHVLGLFSVFNPDLIDQMKYYKTAIPAEYGSSLSSVVDIKTLSNPNKALNIDGNIGLIASRVSIRLALTDKFSIYGSHRASYIGKTAIPLLVKAGIDRRLAENVFEFYDSNLGFNYSISRKTKLSGHMYYGNDKIVISDNERFSISDNNSHWGNKVFVLQLNHVFSENFSMSHNLNYSEFRLRSGINWMTNFYNLQSKIANYNYKTDFVYLKNKHALKAGFETLLANIMPGTVSIWDQNATNNTNTQPQWMHRNSIVSVYVRDEWEHGPLQLNVGVRTSVYIPKQLNAVANNEAEQNNINFGGLEPRMFGRLLLNSNSSIKLSASKHYQFINRIPIINFGIPLEIFAPVTNTIKPSSVWHFSGGYFRNFDANKWEFSTELYYKNYNNLIEYGGNIDKIINSSEAINEFYFGKGKSFGTEVFLRKNTGKVTGWVSYALGWSYRHFDKINNAKPYFANNDRRHDLSLVLMYEATKRLSFSSTFSYASGSRLNLPRSWFVIDNKVILEYSNYNAFKMPDYHRLDVAVNYKLKPIKNIKSELNLAVYNIYNRANPFSIYFSTKSENENSFDFKIKMAYLLPILPSISWTFHI